MPAEPVVESPAATMPAIGRVNIAGLGTRQHCSGALIAPDWVLTAAHCTGFGAGWAEPLDITFVAGWDRGDYIAASRAVEVIRHPSLAAGPAFSYPPGTDLALLRLQTPIDDIPPLPLSGQQAPLSAMALQGYRGDRPHLQSRLSGCEVLRDLGQALISDCPVQGGLSGAPLLSEGQIIGVVSARTTHNGLPASLIGRLDPFIWQALD